MRPEISARFQGRNGIARARQARHCRCARERLFSALRTIRQRLRCCVAPGCRGAVGAPFAKDESQHMNHLTGAQAGACAKEWLPA
jgi:hypothetical protein